MAAGCFLVLAAFLSITWVSTGFTTGRPANGRVTAARRPLLLRPNGLPELPRLLRSSSLLTTAPAEGRGNGGRRPPPRERRRGLGAGVVSAGATAAAAANPTVRLRQKRGNDSGGATSAATATTPQRITIIVHRGGGGRGGGWWQCPLIGPHCGGTNPRTGGQSRGCGRHMVARRAIRATGPAGSRTRAISATAAGIRNLLVDGGEVASGSGPTASG